MRIAHVTDCYLPRLGGIERQVTDLGHQQFEAGHDVHVLTAVSGSGVGSPRLCEHRPPQSRDPGRIQYTWSLRGPAQIRSGKFDVVHAHASTASPLALLSALAAARAGIPTVVTVHSLWTLLAPIYRPLDALLRLRRHPIVWSAVSRPAAQSVKQALHPDLTISLLPNAVDLSRWRVSRQPRNHDRIVIATVGRLAPRKRPRHLLRMLRSARANVPSGIALDVIIAGDGPQRRALQRQLDRHDMSDWVRLIGTASHEQLRAAYAQTDFYVAPATLESFGIAALEARAAGLPVIARAGSGIGDYITHGVDGLLADDDAEMAHAIARLATDPTALGALQANAGTPPAVATWADILDRCDALYAEAAVRSAAPVPSVDGCG